MRRPTVADVLEAVTYVAGVDPMTPGRSKSVTASKVLACHALREITESSLPEIGRAMGNADHTTARHHCAKPVDYDDLRAVAQRVSDHLEAEDRADVLEAWG
jgi:chromosomal replication initiation ATPase DnaA